MARPRKLRGARLYSFNLDVRAFAAVVRKARVDGLGRSQALRDLVMAGAHDPLLAELKELRAVNQELATSATALMMIRSELETELEKLQSRLLKLDRGLHPLKRGSAGPVDDYAEFVERRKRSIPG